MNLKSVSDYYRSYGIRAGLILLVIFILGTAWISTENILRIIRNDGQVAAAHQIIGQIEKVGALTVDLETAYRGFALSGKTEYLEPMGKAQSLLPEEISQLNKLTVQDSFQNQKLQTVSGLIREVSEFGNGVVQTRQNAGQASAESLISTGQGKALMDRVRALLKEMSTVEEARLQQRQAEAQASASQTLWFFLLTLFLSLFFLVFGFYLLERNIKNSRRLEEAELKLLTVVENAPLILCNINADGIVTLSVGRGLGEVGISTGSSVGKSIYEVYADNPSILDKVKTAMGGETAAGLIYIQDYVMEALYKPVLDGAGRVKAVIGIAVDVTARQRAEADLAEKKALLNSVLESMSEGVVVADTKGEMIFFNRSAEKMSGMGAGPEKTNGWLKEQGVFNEDTVTPTPLEDHPITRAIRGEERSNVIQYLRTPQIPQGAYVSVTGKTLRDEQGRVRGGMMVIHDITESRKARESLLSYTKKLEESNRDLQDFIFVASHDLREPLRKIMSFVGFLEEETKGNLNETASGYLMKVHDAARRMNVLIDDLLQLARITTRAKPFELLDISDVIEEVQSDLELRLRECGGRLVIGSLPRLEGDPTQMHQLFQNLIGNALKYRKADVSPVVSIESESDPQTGKCRIRVKDNGIGFDQKYAEKIFNIFQRLHTSDKYEGTGIGLAICRKVVERHNGSITAQSQLGNGSVFEVTLPLRLNT